MPGEDTPAQHKSSESVTDADVQRLINQLLRFPLTSEHDDAPDVLESALPLLRLSAQVGGQAVSGGRGRVLKGYTSRTPDVATLKFRAFRTMLKFSSSQFFIPINFDSVRMVKIL